MDHEFSCDVTLMSLAAWSLYWRPPPKSNDAFPYLRLFTPISEHLSKSIKKLKILIHVYHLLFRKNFFFYPPMFLMNICSHLFHPCIYKHSPCFRSICVFYPNLRVLLPLFWPWCIYALCNATNGRPCIYVIILWIGWLDSLDCRLADCWLGGWLVRRVHRLNNATHCE